MLALVGLTAIVGVGLNVLLGLSGQISLGHVAFYAIGAYVVGILTTKTAIGFWAGAAARGARCRRGRRPARRPGAARARALSRHGDDRLRLHRRAGRRGVERPHRRLERPDRHPHAERWPAHKFAEREIAVFVLACTIAVASGSSPGWRQSPWGKAMRAVRDSEVASQSIGLDPTVIRTVAFAISAAVLPALPAAYSRP